jgi:hypothetical protein
VKIKTIKTILVIFHLFLSFEENFEIRIIFVPLDKNECVTIARILATIVIGITCYDINMWKISGIIK